MPIHDIPMIEELDIRKVVDQCMSPSVRVFSNHFDLEKMKNSGSVHVGDLLIDSQSGGLYVFDGSGFDPIADCYNDPLYDASKYHTKMERVKVCHCPDCGAPVDRSARVCAYCGVPYPIEYE